MCALLMQSRRHGHQSLQPQPDFAWQSLLQGNVRISPKDLKKDLKKRQSNYHKRHGTCRPFPAADTRQLS